MRHRKSFNHLSRKAGHRKAMLANMASSLITHKRITTTTAKAKALRTYIEPLITKSKDDTTHSRRVVFSYLQDKDAVSELFREVAAKVADRPGGYTRILKLGNRAGDSAEMAIIELVDYNPNLLGETGTGKSGSRRRRRGGKKKAETASATPQTAATDVVEDAQVVEESPESGQSAEEQPAESTTPQTEASAEELSAEKTEDVKAEEVEKEEEPKEEEPKAETGEQKSGEREEEKEEKDDEKKES